MQKYFRVIEQYVHAVDVGFIKLPRFNRCQRNQFTCVDTNKNLYLDVMFDAYWKNNLDISDDAILKSLLKKNKIDSDSFFKGIKDPNIKEELKNITQEAHDKEIFGAPTFVVNNKIFWGQDRLEFALDEYNK